MRKLLPYTSYVVCFGYYTNLFDVSFWEEQPLGSSWSSVTRCRLPKEIPPTILGAILHVAAAVDDFEALLEAATSNSRRDEFGVGDLPPKPLDTPIAEHTRPFFLTKLLDRLVWSMCSDQTAPVYTILEHPDVQVPPLRTRKARDGGQKFLHLTPATLDELIGHTVQLARCVQSGPPQWSDHETRASLTEEPAFSQDDLEGDHNPKDLSLSASEDREKLQAATRILYGTLEHGFYGTGSKILENISALAFSAFLLCAGDSRTDFYEDLQKAFPKLARTDEQLHALQRATAAIMREKDRSHRTGLATRAILLALVETPIFVLNPKANLLDHEGLKVNGVGWQHILARAFHPPSATTATQLHAEIEIWQAVASAMGSGLVPATKETAVAGPPRNSIRDITLAVAEPTQTTGPVFVRRLPWDHGKHIPYRVAQERLKLEQVCQTQNTEAHAADDRVRVTEYAARVVGEGPTVEQGHAQVDQEQVPSTEEERELSAPDQTVPRTEDLDLASSPRNQARLQPQQQAAVPGPQTGQKRPRSVQDETAEGEMEGGHTAKHRRSERLLNQSVPDAGTAQENMAVKEQAARKKKKLEMERAAKAKAKAKTKTNHQNKKAAEGSGKTASAPIVLDNPALEPFHRATSYKLSLTDYRDWREEASILQSLSEMVYDSEDDSQGQAEAIVRYPAEVMVVREGRLQAASHTYGVTWPSGASEDRAMFDAVLANRVPVLTYTGEIPKTGTSSWPDASLLDVDVLPRALVETINDPEAKIEWMECLRKRFASAPVHIPSGLRSEIAPAWTGKRDISVEDLQERYLVNTLMERGVHNLALRDEDQFDAHVCRASIRQVLGPPRIPAMNFLDIPSPASVNIPGFLKPVALDSLAGQVPMPSGFPQYSTKWAMFATSPALSRVHIDAAKFSTWVHVIRGAKLWAVLDGPIPDVPLTEIDLNDYRWKVFVVEEGDHLIMPPGTVHVVLTVEDAYTEGGHFYGKHSLTKSLTAGLREKVTGAADTNTQHISAEYILHALVETYAAEMSDAWSGRGGFRQPDSARYDRTLRMWPPLEQLAALLVMVGHAHYFEPEEVYEHSAHTCTVALLEAREATSRKITKFLRYCPQLIPFVEEQEALVRAIAEKPVTSLVESLGGASKRPKGKEPREKNEPASGDSVTVSIHAPRQQTASGKASTSSSPVVQELPIREDSSIRTQALGHSLPPRDNETILEYPPGKRSVCLTRSDLNRLQPQVYLNDALIEFGLSLWLEDTNRSRPEIAKEVHIFSPFFYPKLLQNIKEGYQKLRKWTSKIELFQKRYLIFPINESLHWYLVIICNPGAVMRKQVPSISAEARTDEPMEDGSRMDVDVPASNGVETPEKSYIFSFDSLGGEHPEIFRLLIKYLSLAAKNEHGLSDITFPVTKAAPVPIQQNNYDCGIYLLHFVEQFMSNPEVFTRHIADHENGTESSDIQYDRDVLWNHARVGTKRESMKQEIESLSVEWKKGSERYSQGKGEGDVEDDSSKGRAEINDPGRESDVEILSVI